jgi:hypothetical protein
METKMPRGNPQNLIPNSERAPEQLREQTRKGGVASGEARRKKKWMSMIYADLLSDKYEVTLNGKKVKMEGAKLLQTVARDILLRRDSSSVSLMKEIREATEGQNINIEADITTANVTDGLTYEQKVELAKKWAAENLG